MKDNKSQNFFIKTLNGMAYGLFATLIVGTIFGTIANLLAKIDNDFFVEISSLLKTVSTTLSNLTGAGIGIGIAISCNFDALKTITLASIGEIAACFSLSTKYITSPNSPIVNSIKVGDPLTIYLVCIIIVLFFTYLYKKKTPVDIILIPLVGITLSSIVSYFIRYPSIYVTYAIQYLVNNGTNAVPFIMGVVVSVIMGMALTAPISSAAIAAMIFVLPEGITIEMASNLDEYKGLIIASGAAIVGCSTQMVGFAIQSRKDNDLGMVISIGIGTSMLQFKNILKKPIVWLPTIIASAILGPISTCFVKTICMGSSAGMGTAGLVGQIGTISSMGISNSSTWISIIILEIVSPIILVYFIDLLFRKLNLIKDGDLKV